MKEIEIRLALEGDDKDDSGSAAFRRWRHDHPERENWIVLQAYQDNTFDLTRPEGWTMLKVPGIVPRLYKRIRKGATVVVAWLRAGGVGRQKPYVRGVSPSRMRVSCSVRALNANPGVDVARTGLEVEAGPRPAGMNRDEAWQSGPLGSGLVDFPSALVSGYADDRPYAWALCGARRVVCVDLLTGEVVWSVSKSINSAATIYLDAPHGELVLVDQSSPPTGAVRLQRLSCCTGEVQAISQNISREFVYNFVTLMADGKFICGGVIDPQTRLQVWTRLDALDTRDGEAYVPAYQIPLPTIQGQFVWPDYEATAGHYWPEGDQGLIVSQGPSQLLIAFEVRSGRVLWNWDPFRELGLSTRDGNNFFQDMSCNRDPEDGSIYWIGRLIDVGADHMSYAARITPAGSTTWSIETTAHGVGGSYLDGFTGSQFLGDHFLAHRKYTGTPPAGEGVRPVLIHKRTGGVTDGPLGWQAAYVEHGADWVWGFSQLLIPTSQIRYYVTTLGLGRIADWTRLQSLAAQSRTTPDAGPTVLWNGYVYGTNYDSGATAWRLRRWR